MKITSKVGNFIEILGKNFGLEKFHNNSRNFRMIFKIILGIFQKNFKFVEF